MSVCNTSTKGLAEARGALSALASLAQGSVRDPASENVMESHKTSGVNPHRVQKELSGVRRPSASAQVAYRM